MKLDETIFHLRRKYGIQKILESLISDTNYVIEFYPNDENNDYTYTLKYNLERTLEDYMARYNK